MEIKKKCCLIDKKEKLNGKQLKRLIKMGIKTKLHVTKKVFDNDLVALCKSYI